jgi:hypothetical protein
MVTAYSSLAAWNATINVCAAFRTTSDITDQQSIVTIVLPRVNINAFSPCLKNIPGMRTGGKWSLCRTITSITTMRQGYMEWWIP